MSLEITKYLKFESDLQIAKKISNNLYLEYDYYNNKSLFAYIGYNLLGVLSYEENPVRAYDLYDIFIHNISVHNDMNYHNKPLGIGSKLIYELIDIEKGKIISLRATEDSLPFYQKIGFEPLDGRKLITNNLSKIKKNLEIRLKSPGYVHLTQEDLAKL